MRFDLSDDQREIRRTARELLAERSSWERVRSASEEGAYDEALWRELCELGWPGIAIAEEHGGQGLGAVELAALLEELGYALAPTPFLGSVLAAIAIEAAGSSAQKERWLPALASGEATGAFGTTELVPDAAGPEGFGFGFALAAGFFAGAGGFATGGFLPWSSLTRCSSSATRFSSASSPRNRF